MESSLDAPCSITPNKVKMRYQFYLGHPAHFHLFKNVIKSLSSKGHEIAVLIKKKDILANRSVNTNVIVKFLSNSSFNLTGRM